MFVQDQVEALAAHFDVSIIAPHRFPSFRTNGRREFDEAAHGIAIARPRSLRVPRRPRLSQRPYEWAVRRGVRHLYSGRLPDIIHAHVVLPGGLAAVRLGQELNVPVVLTEHSGPFDMHLSSGWKRAATQEALHGATVVTAVSRVLADEIGRIAHVPVRLTPNLVNPAFFRAQRSSRRGDEALRLLAIGYLTRIKRFDLLLEAFALARSKGLDATLTILGSGSEHANLDRQMARLRLHHVVNIEPIGGRGRVLELLLESDVLVSSSDHESFGLAIAEGLATGIPAIVTASGGPSEFVTPHIGIVVERGRSDAMAAAMLAMPAFRRSFDPETARTAMREFSTGNFVRRTEDIYQEALVAKSP